MLDPLSYPFDSSALSLKKKALKRKLLESPTPFLEKRIAILGGSTTAEIKDILELFLLKEHIRPIFYESEYNKYYEDVMFDNPALVAFKPDVIYFHTTCVNLSHTPRLGDSAEQVRDCLRMEVEKFTALWNKAQERYVCILIQNNVELPLSRALGNRDVSAEQGMAHFVLSLNTEFARAARERRNFYVSDIHSLSAWMGLKTWHDRKLWHAYKYALSYEAIPLLAHNIACIIKSIFGKNKKVLVLDLDNTLWGGVIGDDGVNALEIGKETAVAEAYTAFQDYLRDLKEKGVLLAVCSKNDPEIARQGFLHPDSILKLEDFAAFKANWQTKPQNIEAIAQELNLGLDSFVFIDDNPAERELVRAQLPAVETPEIGNDVTAYIDFIDRAGYFETTALSTDDLKRTKYYEDNAKRHTFQKQFANYEDYLKSLDMKAEIDSFAPVYLDRIAQLINKTNQFNLTTKRYTLPEVEAVAQEEQRYVTLYGRLSDKFGDNGLVSVLIGRREKDELHMDLWLMSCRVLQRNMEQAMFHVLQEECHKRSITTLIGYYARTPKNGMVSDFYEKLGWALVSRNKQDESIWKWVMKPEKHSDLPMDIQRPSRNSVTSR